MKAKKILDDSLKQDGFISQQSVMPQYTSCLKAVQKARRVAEFCANKMNPVEEKMYSREELETAVIKAVLDYTVKGYSKSVNKWIEENLKIL